MSLFATLTLTLLLGAALGWVYFLALWTTVRELPQRGHPGLWVALSFLARLALVVAAFTFVVRWGGWPALAATLAGFLIARTVMVRRSRAVASKSEDQA